MNRKEFYTYLSTIADEIHLQEGAEGIKRLLVVLHRKGRMSTRDISRETRLAPPIVSLVLERLFAGGLLHRDKNGSNFTEKGMKYVERELGLASLDVASCRACEGTGIEIDPGNRHSRLYDKLVKYMAARPSHDVTLDQAKCTVETVLRRLLFLHAWQAFDGTEVLFLGDDDFMSIASCMPELTEDLFIQERTEPEPTFHATMMDIDERIVDQVARIQEEEGISNLDARCHDFREPLPADCRDKFDVAFTDPPYTLKGCKLFLSRAMDALKKERGSRIFLSFGHVASPLLMAIQGIIYQAGFVIEELTPRFNLYEGGNVIGNISQIMVLAAAGAIKPPISPDNTFAGELYTAENGTKKE